MNPPPHASEGPKRLREFVANPTAGREFAWPIAHPSQPTGFCACDGGFLSAGWFYLKAAILLTALRWPFNALKLWILRRAGARIGQQVYLSADVWIDPVFPQLLTIEDDVLVGVGARIALHEFGQKEFRAGRVLIRKGALVGGFALIRHGVEIGEGAVVAGGAVVGRDVPAGRMAVGNPARILPLERHD
jgi:acetyltransferase-like isoleucine patch superfamily enzyme